MKKSITFLSLLIALTAQSQLPDHIYQPSIRTVKLYKYGDMYGYPVITLGGADVLVLDFDDMDADVKNCYYTYQLCNADWTPAPLVPYDYIRGFQNTRITTYRYSSISFTKYTHYEAAVPDKNCVPTRSGNYLLKVFLNSDTSQLLFTKRFLVVDNRVAIAAQIVEPFSGQISLTDQRVKIGVNTANSHINALSPQDLRVVILQNYIWPTAVTVNRPNIFRGNYYEYNDDATAFPSGREYRWLDLRSFRLMSDRMAKIVDTAQKVEIYVKPDVERKGEVFVLNRDQNGIYTLGNTDGNNPNWQSDYAHVHFTLVPPGGQAYPGKDIHIFGELTNYVTNDASRMVFNSEKGVYEITLFLKQGYYNYSYVSKNAAERSSDRFSYSSIEGNNNTTENNYSVLVYYRSFGGRYDELLGYIELNSLNIR